MRLSFPFSFAFTDQMGRARAVAEIELCKACRPCGLFLMEANKDRARSSITVFLGTPDAGSSWVVGHSYRTRMPLSGRADLAAMDEYAVIQAESD